MKAKEKNLNLFEKNILENDTGQLCGTIAIAKEPWETKEMTRQPWR
jgi:hypothetical protein